jgi:hypothetical protein
MRKKVEENTKDSIDDDNDEDSHPKNSPSAQYKGFK